MFILSNILKLKRVEYGGSLIKHQKKVLNLSDEKREKLREYLRNNRPKNKINLGNSSDNKKKFLIKVWKMI
jgi:hypothetical protein